MKKYDINNLYFAIISKYYSGKCISIYPTVVEIKDDNIEDLLNDNLITNKGVEECMYSVVVQYKEPFRAYYDLDCKFSKKQMLDLFSKNLKNFYDGYMQNFDITLKRK